MGIYMFAILMSRGKIGGQYTSMQMRKKGQDECFISKRHNDSRKKKQEIKFAKNPYICLCILQVPGTVHSKTFKTTPESGRAL